MTADDWQRRAVRLADSLVASGELVDAGWYEAFTRVPRHVFVPGHDLDEAYGTDVIVTQTRSAPVAVGDPVSMPTSSASAPGAVAIMLDRLGLTDRARVLEIGTGTGYNTALLCTRLGDESVTSIDLDPGLVATAASRLAELGVRPTLLAGDGADGAPGPGTFDAILATCAVTHIPPAWVRQLAPGGRLVAPLYGGHDGALLVAGKTADDEVTGRIDPAWIGFMPLRADVDNPLADGGTLGTPPDGMAHYGSTVLDPAPLLAPDPDYALFLHLHVAGLVLGTSGEPASAVMVGDATSVAEAGLEPVDPGVWAVTQRGPRRLWDSIEHATRLWRHLDHPARHRFGLSALDRVDRQYVWLDDPDGRYAWPLPW